MTMRSRARLIIAIILAAGFIGLLLALIFVEIPEKNLDMVQIMTGFLGGAFMTMTAFYYGDSEGKDVVNNS